MANELLDNLDQSLNPDGYEPCPNCDEIDYTKIHFTLWGGFLFTKMLHHVRCNNCGTTYNGQTGMRNRLLPLISLVVIVGIIGILIVFIFAF